LLMTRGFGKHEDQEGKSRGEQIRRRDDIRQRRASFEIS
jgi:hypothetical protein